MLPDLPCQLFINSPTIVAFDSRVDSSKPGVHYQARASIERVRLRGSVYGM